MYPRYIFLHEEGGPSVWISTHMLHRRMEMKIDQITINIQLTTLKTTNIISHYNLG